MSAMRHPSALKICRHLDEWGLLVGVGNLMVLNARGSYFFQLRYDYSLFRLSIDMTCHVAY